MHCLRETLFRREAPARFSAYVSPLPHLDTKYAASVARTIQAVLNEKMGLAGV